MKVLFMYFVKNFKN